MGLVVEVRIQAPRSDDPPQFKAATASQRADKHSHARDAYQHEEVPVLWSARLWLSFWCRRRDGTRGPGVRHHNCCIAVVLSFWSGGPVFQTGPPRPLQNVREMVHELQPEIAPLKKGPPGAFSYCKIYYEYENVRTQSGRASSKCF